MTLNIQHGNGAVVVVRGPWIDKDSRKNHSSWNIACIRPLDLNIKRAFTRYRENTVPVWLLLAFNGVCVSAVVNLYCVAKGLAGLLLGAMLVCTFIWYRTRFMNYILLGVVEFMLVGVLAAGAFILALVTEARDGVGRFIIGG